MTVILDALNDLNSLRKKYVKENPEFNKYVLVLFPRTLEQIRYYNKQRNDEAIVPDDQLEILVNKWEEPSEEIIQLFDTIDEVRW